LLLAAYGTRRPTRDIDVQARALAGDLDSIRAAVAQVAALPADDGLVFHDDKATVEEIRDEDEYGGARVKIPAELATCRGRLQVDVNIGDPISPGPQLVELPRLIDDSPIRLNGYPLHMVHAEKIVTAYQRGIASTRWRDFADIYLLATTHP
jgi:hypothetical protein